MMHALYILRTGRASLLCQGQPVDRGTATAQTYDVACPSIGLEFGVLESSETGCKLSGVAFPAKITTNKYPIVADTATYLVGNTAVQ